MTETPRSALCLHGKPIDGPCSWCDRGGDEAYPPGGSAHAYLRETREAMGAPPSISFDPVMFSDLANLLDLIRGAKGHVIRVRVEVVPFA